MSVDSLERWRPIPGYEGLYEVSDLGRVRGVDRLIDHGHDNGAVRRITGRVKNLRRGGPNDGRLYVSLSKLGRKQTHRVSQLVLEAFVGPRPEGYHGCHNDGDATNNHLSNLRWDTPSGNQLDTVRHGTHRYARRTHCARRHRYTPANTVYKGTTRICLKCKRIQHERDVALARERRQRMRPVFSPDDALALRQRADQFDTEIGAAS